MVPLFVNWPFQFSVDITPPASRFDQICCFGTWAALGRGLIEGVELNFLRILLAAALIGLTFPSPVLSQDVPKPVRLRFARGKNTIIATGYVGGEATDYYVVRLRAGQKVTIHAISRRKRTQVSIAPAVGDFEVPGEQSDTDWTRWAGKVPRTGDYIIQVNVHPYGERYTLKVTVK